MSESLTAFLEGLNRGDLFEELSEIDRQIAALRARRGIVAQAVLLRDSAEDDAP